MSLEGPQTGTWLCPSELDRARLLDMTGRIMPASAAVGLVCAPVSALLVARVGFVFVLPFALISAYIAASTGLAKRAKPEYWLFAGDCLMVACIAAAAALTGGDLSPCWPTLMLPLVAVAGRHTRRALLVFFPLTIAVTIASAVFAVNRHVDFSDLRLPALIGTMTSLLILMLALMRAEVQYHRESMLDPLTGLFNRLALARKLRELSAQPTSGALGICVIAADIDHFKSINDTYGHARGDDVLRELAVEMQTRLRAFSLIYRTGGEEFAIVLPGLDIAEGREIAERLRAGVEQANVAELHVTMSFGVASSAGGALDFDATMRAADVCLYEAKRSGRNRVVTAATSQSLPQARPAEAPRARSSLAPV